jgi:hypothetical protein
MNDTFANWRKKKKAKRIEHKTEVMIDESDQ